MQLLVALPTADADHLVKAALQERPGLGAIAVLFAALGHGPPPPPPPPRSARPISATGVASGRPASAPRRVAAASPFPVPGRRPLSAASAATRGAGTRGGAASAPAAAIADAPATSRQAPGAVDAPVFLVYHAERVWRQRYLQRLLDAKERQLSERPSSAPVARRAVSGASFGESVVDPADGDEMALAESSWDATSLSAPSAASARGAAGALAAHREIADMVKWGNRIEALATGPAPPFEPQPRTLGVVEVCIIGAHSLNDAEYPFAKVTIAGREHHTEVVNCGTEPEWERKVVSFPVDFEWPEDRIATFEVCDWDADSSRKCMGSATVDLQANCFDEVTALSLPLTGSVCVTGCPCPALEVQLCFVRDAPPVVMVVAEDSAVCYKGGRHAPRPCCADTPKFSRIAQAQEEVEAAARTYGSRFAVSWVGGAPPPSPG